jgi:hypothetical protein
LISLSLTFSVGLENPGGTTGLVIFRENLIVDFSGKRVETPLMCNLWCAGVNPGGASPGLSKTRLEEGVSPVQSRRCADVNPGGGTSRGNPGRESKIRSPQAGGTSPGLSKTRLDEAVSPVRSWRCADVNPGGGASRGNPGRESKIMSPQAGALVAALHGEPVVQGKYSEKPRINKSKYGSCIT